jgi:hypothetical protein
MINFNQQRQQQNDAKIHRAAQLEASRYLADKRTQRDAKLDDWFFITLSLVLFCLFLTTAGIDIHKGVF